jgi:hypothetical protein
MFLVLGRDARGLVRDRDWKLIRFFEDGYEELYNLREDIGETRNLADSEPEKRAELSAKLTAWQGEMRCTQWR